VVLLVGGGVGWFVQQSSAAEWKTMPAEITRLSQEDQALAIDPQVDAQIAGIEQAGLSAVAGNDRSGAKNQLALLKDMKDRLSIEYDLRVPYEWDEDTGVWRIPRTNPNGRNYYLIVEAVRPGGGTIEVPVRDEETNKIERVSKWGQRVTRETFDKFKDEKSTSGITQNDILGHKARGELEPKFDVPTPGGAITKW
jgi:hypothetical protein